MGYLVHKHYIRKDGTTRWRVVFEEIRDGKRFQRVIPKPEWAKLGLDPDMSLDDARAILEPRNLRGSREKQERAKQNIQNRLAKEDKEKCEFLPRPLVNEFEEKILFRRLGLEGANAELARLRVHWRAVQRLIKEIKQHPDEWCDAPEIVYSYFIRNKVSLSYAEKQLRLLNAWGTFVVKKNGKQFWPIPAPTGRMRERISDAFFSKPKIEKRSAPITPQQLQLAKGNLKTEQYNFLYLSIWFGLRPSEIEQFRSYNDHYWRVEDRDDLKVLWVYQPKLASIPREERWKLIPVLFPEQVAALEIINSGHIERPLAKTIRRWVNPHANNYGGRKGFHALMKAREQVFEDISAWMGHQSLDRTWKDYRERLKLSLKKR